MIAHLKKGNEERVKMTITAALDDYIKKLDTDEAPLGYIVQFAIINTKNLPKDELTETEA